MRSEAGETVKGMQTVGRRPGPDTLVVLIGSFRAAARWAAAEGLHLEQWTLIESCSSLTVYDRRFAKPSKEAPNTVLFQAADKAPTHRRRAWWRLLSAE